jgi:predicted alpha/beta hydrolase family esterase
MKKQVFVIHGGDAWDTYEEYIAQIKRWTFDPYEVRGGGWKKSLALQLGDDYEVILPTMPSKYNAKYMEWCIWMEKIVPHIRNNAILIGHSLGANFLVKFFSENVMPFSVLQLHLVAGCYGSGGGFELSENIGNIQKQCLNIFIYHSTDDPIVSYSDAQKYHIKLPHAHLETFADRGHFLQEDFPEIVERIRKF